MLTKKVFSSVVVALMLGLVACGGGDPNPPPSDNKPPVALFTSSATTPALTPLVFDASTSSDPENDPLVYSWDFGDVEHGGGAKIAHQFAKAGSFTVKLTVADGKGGSNSTTKTITVSSNGTAGASVTVTGQVADVNGALAGVKVEEIGGTISSVTAADGTVSIALSVGVPHTLKLSKTGYADQFQPVNLPSSNSDGFFKVGMMAREAAQNLNASSGGSLTGKDSAKITLPPSGLVDSDGNPVSGTVQIALSPVDISGKMISSFPGQFAGVKLDGTQTPIASYGTTEFALSQNGKRLQLAAGKTATIELPIYATQNFDGSSLKVGDSIPLWSLSETTGLWVQEGVGIVVSSSAPSGFSMRATVSHFSWWNSDVFVNDPYTPKPKCLLNPGPEFQPIPIPCTIGPKLPGEYQTQSVSVIQTKALPTGFKYPPSYNIKTDIPLEGGVQLAVPAGVDFTFHACAKNGTYCGDKTVNGAAGAKDEVQILLNPVATGGSCSSPATITAPLEQDYVITSLAQANCFNLSLQVGQILTLGAKQGNNFGLTGSVQISKPDGTTLKTVNFGTQLGTLEVVAPITGVYQIKVNATAKAPGGYHLSARITIPNQLALPSIASYQFDTGNDSRFFSVDAVAGDVIAVSVRPTAGTSKFYAIRSLQDGSSRSFKQIGLTFDYGYLTLKATTTGTIGFEVASVANSGANFLVSISRASSLALGTADSGVVNADGTVKSYTFEGTAGSVIAIASRLNTTNPPPLRLFDPSGTELDASNFSPYARGPVALPSSGTYRFDVFTYLTATPYTVRAVTVDNPAPVNPTGQITTTGGSIGIADQRYYSLNLTQGDVVRFSISSPDALDPTLELLAPDASKPYFQRPHVPLSGSAISENVPITIQDPASKPYFIATSGEYIVHISGQNTKVSSATGTFSWNLLKPTPVPLAVDTLTSGTLAAPYGFNRYSLNIVVPGYYLYYPNVTSTETGIFALLRDPNGIELGFIQRESNGAINNRFDIRALPSGNHTIDIFGHDKNAVSYNMIAVSLEPPVVMTTATTKNGTIDQPGERDYYQFSATAGQTYTISSTSSLTGSVYVHKLAANGNFTQDFPVDGSVGSGVIGGSISFTPVEAGTYIIQVVVTNSNTPTGNYSLTLN